MTQADAEPGTNRQADSSADADELPDELVFSSPRGRWVLAATVLGTGIAFLDSTVVGIALPSINRAFGGGVSTLQWVVTGYSLTLAAFLLIGGSLGDRLGRRRMFSLGIVWFAVASALCGIAPNGGFLIGARFVQGIGGALLTPGSLAIIQASFRPEDRGRAIGAWSGLGGVATAAGPLIGGYLLAVASWRWVFYINVPIAIFVLYITARHVPESTDPTVRGRIDGAGATLGVVFLAGVSYALIQAPTQGWSNPLVITALVLVALSGPAFLVLENRLRDPMLPLDLFRSKQFSGANAVTFVVYGGLGGALFLVPVELQLVAHYTPLDSGLALLPMTLVMLVFSARSGELSARIGPRLQMSVGPIVAGVGLALLAMATHNGSYWTHVFPAVLVLSAGLAITVAPLTSTAMGAAPAEHSGIASAVNNTVARAAGLFAVAVLPLAAGMTGAAGLTPHELAHGFRTAVYIAGATCAFGGLLATLTIRNPARPPAKGAEVKCPYSCAVSIPPPRPLVTAADTTSS
jgi:EmrB/QacA subfamily drug resistance transporter